MDATVQKLKVLIIDDDPSLGVSWQVVFERDGFETSVANEGSEGFDGRWWILLISSFSTLDGRTFTIWSLQDAARQFKPTADRHYYYIGKSYKPDIDKAMELGADSYVVKPFSPKNFLNAIKHEWTNEPTMMNIRFGEHEDLSHHG